VIVIFELDLRNVKVTQCVKYLSQTSSSSNVIVQRHRYNDARTNPADCWRATNVLSGRW